MKITITTGTGTGPTAIAAFDAALRCAGVANYNLIALSSIIPPGSVIERARFVAPDGEYGHRLYVVMARCDVCTLGKQAWAGIGWVQEPANARGLFVEICGGEQAGVQAEIEATLGAMMACRGHTYGPIDSALAGITCSGMPVCALSIAVYQSQGWQ